MSATPLELRHEQLKRNDMARLSMIRAQAERIADLVFPDHENEMDLIELLAAAKVFHHLVIVARNRADENDGGQ
jgi:hypothetical protein